MRKRRVLELRISLKSMVVFIVMMAGLMSCRYPQGSRSMEDGFEVKAISDHKYRLSLVEVYKIGGQLAKIPQLTYDHKNRIEVPVVRFDLCEVATDLCVNPFYYKAESNRLFSHEVLFSLLPRDLSALSEEDLAEVVSFQKEFSEKYSGYMEQKDRAQAQYEQSTRNKKSCEETLLATRKEVKEKNEQAFNEWKEHQDHGKMMWLNEIFLKDKALRLTSMPKWNCEKERQNAIQAGIKYLRIDKATPELKYPEILVPLEGDFVIGPVNRQAKDSFLLVRGGEFKAVLSSHTHYYSKGSEAVTEVLKLLAQYLKNNLDSKMELGYVCLPQKGRKNHTVTTFRPFDGRCVDFAIVTKSESWNYADGN